MKVRLILEVTESQRNALSRQLKPKAKRRLATRDEVRSFVRRQVASLHIPVDGTHQG